MVRYVLQSEVSKRYFGGFGKDTAKEISGARFFHPFDLRWMLVAGAMWLLSRKPKVKKVQPLVVTIDASFSSLLSKGRKNDDAV